jgi:HK97 family phage prohead protease
MAKTIDELKAALPQQERRFLDALVEVRAEDDMLRIGGTIPYGAPSESMFGFTEVIEPSFFRKSIKDKADIRGLWNHDPRWVLARTTNKTLRLVNTKEALDWEADLDAEDPMHRHFARRIERRDVTGTSFGFEIVRDEWEHHDDGTVLRHLIEGKVFDISPVTYPAYPTSDAEARSAERACRLDIAVTRSGIELGELAEILGRVTAQRALEQDAAALQGVLDRLAALLPGTITAPADDWDAVHAARNRRLGLVERLVRVA